MYCSTVWIRMLGLQFFFVFFQHDATIKQSCLPLLTNLFKLSFHPALPKFPSAEIKELNVKFFDSVRQQKNQRASSHADVK